MTLPKEVLDGLDDVIVDLLEKSSHRHAFRVRSRAVNVTEIRAQLGLTQQEFALRFRFPLKTLQNWEQGVREPEGPARAYLIVIKNSPSAVFAALAAENALDEVDELKSD